MSLKNMLLTATVSLTAVLLSASLCISSAQDETSEPLMAYSYSEQDVIEVKPLDHPDNPYSGQYTWLDEWKYKNALHEDGLGEARTLLMRESPELEALKAERAAGQSTDGLIWKRTTLSVDADGFVIPAERMNEIVLDWQEREKEEFQPEVVRDLFSQLHSVRMQAALESVSASEAPKKKDITYGIQSAGWVTPEQLAEIEFYEKYSEAIRHSPIPAWLGSEAPAAAVFLPGERVLVKGKLGVVPKGIEDREFVHAYPGTPESNDWYLYTLEGELLEHFPAQDIGPEGGSMFSQWQNVFLPDAEFSFSSKRDTTYSNKNGYVFKYKYEPVLQEITNMPDLSVRYKATELLSAMTYEGEPVSLDAAIDPELDDPKLFRLILGEFIPEIYRAQERLGQTGEWTASPFEGQSDGPQRYEGPSLLEIAIASHPHPDDHISVIVKQLDSPDNPYAGLYSKWDEMLFEKAKPANRDQPVYINEEPEKASIRKEISEKALAENWSVEKYEQARSEAGIHGYGGNYFGMAFNPQESISLKSYCSEDGFLMPQEERIREQMSRSAYLMFPGFGSQAKEELPELQATVDVGESVHEEYDKWVASVKASELPQIPAWLADNPPFSAIVGRDGEWITNTPLGFAANVTDFNQLRKDFWGREEKLWYRYSPSGVLLESGPQERGWIQFYAPELADLYEQYSSVENHSPRAWGNYFAVVSHEIKEVPKDDGTVARHIVNQQTLFVKTLDGEEVAEGTILQLDESKLGFTINSYDLKDYYEAQQAGAGWQEAVQTEEPASDAE